MRLTRLVTLGLTTALSISAAWAQFSGPTPLAWRWSTNVSASPSGAPIVNGESVIVTAGNRIFALDRRTGNQKWRFPVADPIPGNFRNGMTLAEGVVVAGGDNKLIYGIDAATGGPKWTFTPASPMIGQPVVAGKLVIFASSDNTITALNAADGTSAWAMPFRVFDGLLGGLIARDNSLVYTTGTYEMVSMNVVTQKTNWKRRFTVIGADATPTLYGDNLFLNIGSFAACINWNSGVPRWQQNLGEPLSFGPAVTPNGTLVVSRDGNAFMLNTNTGQPLIRRAIPIGSSPIVRPIAAGEGFLIPTSNGAINLMNAKGDVTWSYLIRPLTKTASQAAASGGNSGGGAGSDGGGAGGGQSSAQQIWSIPAAGQGVISGSTLLVQAVDGSLLAFDKNDGVDLTGPTISMNWPKAGDQVSGQPPLEFIFRIMDEGVGVNNSTIKLQIDGQDLEFSYGRDGFAIARISALGKNKPLFDGRKNITVTATDWLGNSTTSKFTLMVDNTLRPLVRPSGSGPANPGGGGPGGGGLGGGRGGGGAGGGL